jgi:hypothetical protein
MVVSIKTLAQMLLSQVSLALILHIALTNGDCILPDEIVGEFYSYENGYETFTNMYKGGHLTRKQYSREAGAGASGDSTSTLKLKLDEQGTCVSLVKFSHRSLHPSKWHYKMHYRPTAGLVTNCNQCIEIYNRTRSVLEVCL